MQSPPTSPQFSRSKKLSVSKETMSIWMEKYNNTQFELSKWDKIRNKTNEDNIDFDKMLLENQNEFVNDSTNDNTPEMTSSGYPRTRKTSIIPDNFESFESRVSTDNLKYITQDILQLNIVVSLEGDGTGVKRLGRTAIKFERFH